jgi:heat shock protein HspQ
LNSIPEESRPSRDQPYYHLFAENSQTTYIAYVSEQNLLLDESGEPVSHPQVGSFFFNEIEDGHYTPRDTQAN